MPRSKNRRPRLKPKKGRPWRIHWITDQGVGKSFSTRTRDESEARKLLVRAQAKFDLDEDPSEVDPASQRSGSQHDSTSWTKFRERYVADMKARNLRRSTIVDCNADLNFIEKMMQPMSVADIATTEVLEELRDAYKRGEANDRYGGKPRSNATVRTFLGSILAAFRWAFDRGMIEKVPTVERPKTPVGFAGKGRALFGEEIDRFYVAIPLVVGDSAAVSWKLLIDGLINSGLRIGEILDLHWKDESRVRPIKVGSTWYFALPSDRNKSRRHDQRPMIPIFSEFLESISERDRTGFVFNPQSLNTRLGRKPKTDRANPDWVSRVIARIGKRARIVVDAESGKTASAHDLRRTFGQRLVDRGVPIELAADALGHRDRRTTQRFYTQQNAVRQTQRLAEFFTATAQNETVSGTLSDGELESGQVASSQVVGLQELGKYTPEDSNL